MFFFDEVMKWKCIMCKVMFFVIFLMKIVVGVVFIVKSIKYVWVNCVVCVSYYVSECKNFIEM